MDAENTRLEAQLLSLKPNPIPDDLLVRLDYAMLMASSENVTVEHEDTVLIEETLAGLIPHELPDEILNRLDRAMSETSLIEEKIVTPTLHPELSSLEESLRGLSPHGMPEDMISRLDQAMSRWHEEVPVEEKVVSMTPDTEAASKKSWFGLRSAAAVGLLGAAMAFFFTGPQPSGEVAKTPRIPVLTDGRSGQVNAAFSPSDARAAVVSTNDHGVVWTKGGQPLRCVELRSKKQVEFVNERGERLFIEQPAREVRFIPVKFD